LGVHPNTLYNWRRTEKGPPWIQIANRAVYDLAAVEQWELETGRTRKGGDAAHP